MQDLDSYEMVMLINRLAGKMHKYMDKKLKSYGLARTQYLVLAYLHETGSLPTSELVAKLMVEPATLSGIIDTLERKGLATRVAHSVDKRRKDVKLTDAGKKLVDVIPIPRQAAEQVLRAGIDSKEIESTIVVGRKMLDNLEEATRKE